MASSQTIHDSLLASVRAENETIDTTKGPVYDLLLRPVPDEIAGPSVEIDNIKTLYSPLISINPDNNAAIDTLGTAFRVSKPTGQRARTSLVFWFTTLPQQDITIPAGTAVGTQDRSVIYTTTSDIAGINSQTAYGYYNSTSGRYEVYVDAVATQDGSGFEVPAFRLTFLLSRLQGISGVYNPIPGTGGISAGGYDTYIALIQKRFLGRDSSSFTSYQQQAVELYPDVVTNFISPNDRRSFRRSLRGDGFDVIVANPSPTSTEETFQVNSDKEFVPMHQPLLYSTGDDVSVYLNGSIIQDYVYIEDTDPTTSRSAKAKNRISFKDSKIKLKTSDTIRIRHNYCSYCFGLQNQLFSVNADDFFGHDTLVRLSVPTDLYISISIQTNSINADFQTSLSSYVMGFVSGLGFVSNLSIGDLTAAIYSTYTEVRSVSTTSFRRLNNAGSEIETIDFAGYEIPRLLVSNLQIKVFG